MLLIHTIGPALAGSGAVLDPTPTSPWPQRYMIDMENMFELLGDVPEVADAPGAAPLTLGDGTLEFRNVSFGYQPARTILRNVSLTVRFPRLPCAKAFRLRDA